jgi:hypothetical protein
MKLMLKKIFLVSLFSLSIEAADVPKTRKNCNPSCLNRLATRINPHRNSNKKYSDRFIFTCTWALIIGGFASAWLESLKYLAKENDRRMLMTTKVVIETNDKAIAMIKKDIESVFTEIIEDQNSVLENQNAVLEEILKKLQNFNKNNVDKNTPVEIQYPSMYPPTETLDETEKKLAEYYYLAKNPEE